MSLVYSLLLVIIALGLTVAPGALILASAHIVPSLKRLYQRDGWARVATIGLNGLLAFLGGFLFATLFFSLVDAAFYPSDRLQHAWENWVSLLSHLPQGCEAMSSSGCRGTVLESYVLAMALFLGSGFISGAVMLVASYFLLPRRPNDPKSLLDF